MRKFKLLVIIFAFSLLGQCLHSQIEIPDTNLKQKLASANSTNNQIAFNSAGGAIVIDTNGDGLIQQGEADSVYRLSLRHISGSRIESIVGLDLFHNLTSLDVNGQNIYNSAELYALSTTLNYLDISLNHALDNDFLNFAGTSLSNLETLKASNIGFNTINITGLASLEELDVSYNFLTTLNFTGCSSLQLINVFKNRFPNERGAVGIQSLIYGSGDTNNVTALNVSTNDLSNLSLSDFPNLESLNISNNNFTLLDVSDLNNLNVLKCDDNNISSINFGTIDQLSNLSCLHNSITELDISNLSNLQILSCSNNQLTSLDLSNNSQLSELSCSNNNLITMYLKNNGPLLASESYFDFHGNPNLNYICEDAYQIYQINDIIDINGYTGVTVDSNCNKTTCQIEPDFGYGRTTFADPCLYSFTDKSEVPLGFDVAAWIWTVNGEFVSNSQDFNYTFSSNGTYLVCLTATGYNGKEKCSNTICKKVEVTSCNISSVCEIKADFNSKLISRSSCLYSFTDESEVPLGVDVAAWTWTVNGNFVSNSKDFNYTFPSNGTYLVCLTATGYNGKEKCSNTICEKVKVTSCNNPSVCEIKAGFNYKLKSCEYLFTDKSEVPLGVDVAAWTWTVSGNFVSNSKDFNYTFPSNGTYLVCLTATGFNGKEKCSNTICEKVTVNNCFTILKSKKISESTTLIDNSVETLKIWPNPSKGTYYLDIGNGNIDVESIEIYTILGKKLPIETAVENSYVSIKIDSSYESGVYFLIFKNGDELISSRLIKY